MKTIALLSNNVFYSFGLRQHVPDYELTNISLQHFEEQDPEHFLTDFDLFLVKSEWASPEEILSFIQLALEQEVSVIYLCHKQDKLVPQLLSVGCQGIVEEQNVDQQLSLAVKALESGGTYYSQKLLNDSYMVLLGPLVELFEELNSNKEKLTPKEKQITDYYIQGLGLTDIMGELNISRSTVNTHMESIRRKFQVSHNREIIAKYQIARLVSE